MANVSSTAGGTATPRKLPFAVEFYRHVVRGVCGAPPPDDPALRAAVAAAILAREEARS